ncbi:AGE family epimerase/isomerase [Oleiagrimonas sp. MCCC 1A03011]|uniref:AGE family epimerase/isomerase n=1 Tax=Oleiagrimonas sp. MCCC 1A03011 TaxID=1926883 RepID=UPI001F0CB762|nr:AGE family epimerase/isomerase [Oleiagrimonas sp. MCCC 1A03011]
MTPKLPATPVPDFRSREFLRQHIADIMDFYYPRCIDPVGGYFQYFHDDGSIYDTRHRHLVSSTRFVFNFAMAARHFGSTRYAEAARHGLNYLREMHRDSTTGGYVWTLYDGLAEDRTNHCYGVAFVMLAYATAHKAGSEQAAEWMDETWQLLEERFWDADAGLYRDEADADWHFSAYRGQNANMHMCEALLCAYEATGNDAYLDRALLLADNMTRRQADQTNGLIWEHYDENWNVDWDYNRDNPKHLFRPWGFQPGHQTEWAKLLLILDRHCRRPASERGQPVTVPGWNETRVSRASPPPIAFGAARSPVLDPVADREASPQPSCPELDWLLPTARRLFDTAVALAWDKQYGGLCYGFDPDGNICDDDKYFWVQAETLTTAALLAHRTDMDAYWLWYERIWTYAWQHMVDHQHGGWYRILDRMNQKYDNKKSPAGKTDYHTMGACYEVLNVIGRSGAQRLA